MQTRSLHSWRGQEDIFAREVPAIRASEHSARGGVEDPCVYESVRVPQQEATSEGAGRVLHLRQGEKIRARDLNDDSKSELRVALQNENELRQ